MLILHFRSKSHTFQANVNFFREFSSIIKNKTSSKISANNPKGVIHSKTEKRNDENIKKDVVGRTIHVVNGFCEMFCDILEMFNCVLIFSVKEDLKMKELETKEHLSFKVNNVTDAFKNLPQKGKHEKFTRLPYFANIAPEHIQGYTQYENGKLHFVFTHSSKGDYGRIVITDGLTNKAKRIHTPKNWSHPAGIQCIGKYLFVPCGTDSKSKLCIYDVNELANEDLETNPPLKTIDFNHRGGSVGIVDFSLDGTPHYLLVLGDRGTYHAYISPIPVDGDITKTNFSRIGSYFVNYKKDKKIDCQGFGLVTDTSGEVFMIALSSHGKGLSYADWGYLIGLSVTKTSITPTEINRRQFINNGGIDGVDGPHFRWGAGIRVTPSGKLVLLTTSRNIIIGGNLDTTYWA